MGEVYRARDSKLNREIALKVLPSAFAKDADRMARFQREAQVLASLNHPNIAAIHGLEESGGIRALVMELVEGPTLAERISQGRLLLEEALTTARQIAEGLEYAHEKGIVHRDLKPANVKITAEGVAKILDFGLAKAAEQTAPSGDPSNSPTFSLGATQAGVILGTAAYMSPEQARGKVADKRADIWAFGVVLFEMLAGKQAFEDETISDMLAAVIKSEPSWDLLPAGIPGSIRKLLRRCLVKDPRLRLRDVGEARITIDECLAGPVAATEISCVGSPVGMPKTSLKRERLLWAMLVAVLLLATIASTVAYFKQAPAPERTIIAEVLPSENSQFNFNGPSGGSPVLSPDGHTLAFSATDANGKKMLWVRSLDSSAAQPLAGTEGAVSPFWSADSRALGFFADDKLKTIEVSGTPAVVLAEAPAPAGGSWNRSGTILFVPNYRKGLYRVAASGGAPVTVILEDDSKYSGFAWPRFLPDGEHFLYSAGSADPALDGTHFASLDRKENRLLLRASGLATYASGFLLYVRNNILMAQTFDPERGELKGNPHPVAERVVEDSGRAPFDASENGVLIYQQAAGRAGGRRRMRWFDRAGKELELPGETGAYCDVRLSADGRKLAVNVGDPYGEIWVNDLERGVGMRLTIDPDTDHGVPVWSPDGRRILFAALAGKARLGIYQKPSNGAGGEELLLASETPNTPIFPTSWSSDGRFILYGRGDPGSPSQSDIWVLPFVGDRKPRLFVKTLVAAYDGQFSPDARWVAYTSKESGREEVYVVPFDPAKVLNAAPASASASAGVKWIISMGGGHFPRWRKDGKEIFYLSPENKMTAVGVEVRGGSIELQVAQPLFTASPADFFSPYDVTADGSRFVINTLSVQNTPLTLVVNWTARLGQ
jgi:serine/threonine protein kinase/Tol biopolymer transport system component